MEWKDLAGKSADTAISALSDAKSVSIITKIASAEAAIAKPY